MTPRAVVTGVLVSLLGVTSAATADSGGKVFTGAARGLTADQAIRRAINDGAVSASAEGLYTCVLVGQPRLFETFNDPFFGHLFRAEADVSCTP